VTGANKGIGYEIVRQLSRQFRGTVYLTGLPASDCFVQKSFDQLINQLFLDFFSSFVLSARDAGRGAAAEKALHDEGLTNVAFLQMDVNDKKSIEQARDFVREKHGGLDILVNNAGILICLAGVRTTCQSSPPCDLV
jgi:carbonyl reductase 1